MDSIRVTSFNSEYYLSELFEPTDDNYLQRSRLTEKFCKIRRN